MRGYIAVFFLVLLLCYNVVSARQMDYDNGLKNAKNNQCVNFQKIKKVIKSDKGRVNARGQVLSYAWIRDQKALGEEVEENIAFFDWGITYDTVLNLDLVSKRSNFGVVGASLQLLMPMSQGRTGSLIFINNDYGKLSFGYQAGVESNIKVDAFSIAVGDTSDAWVKYIKYFAHHSEDIPFYLPSGLYSETLSSDNENGIVRFLSTTKGFMHSLPFRISYSFTGFSNMIFGVSYMPLGYKIQNNSGYDITSITNTSNILIENLQLGLYKFVSQQQPSILPARLTILEKIQLRGDAINKVDVDNDANRIQNVHALTTKYIVSPYKNVISGGLSYTYDIASTKIVTSLIGEYAKSEKVSDNLNSDIIELEYYDLTGVAAGVNVLYDKLKLGCAYGYLGKSGIIKYNFLGKKYLDFISSGNNSYYWNFGGSYEYNDLSLSVTYLYSVTNSNYITNKIFDVYFLKDFTVGLEYMLYNNNKVHCKLFSNYHVFNLLQSTEIFFDTNAVDDVEKDVVKYNGVVFLLGVKVEF
ncbi:hypothetical protein [Candidatus Neoehrlichia procyonis]|uniref:Gram-negative porin family protein n=1 Tax=Candidatus Neoehrlichia procyonis str. RAC413 TaxID=1359163 RepID=A0A0F3NPV7_9RICK|nr:hypothetical protein [Candidatus Neoehrlichia lotoris]KJV68954.1 hypothetical protein NLO413_0326 [Candidatus Neoehrlichia lotoris str. RAC413]